MENKESLRRILSQMLETVQQSREDGKASLKKFEGGEMEVMQFNFEIALQTTIALNFGAILQNFEIDARQLFPEHADTLEWAIDMVKVYVKFGKFPPYKPKLIYDRTDHTSNQTGII